MKARFPSLAHLLTCSLALFLAGCGGGKMFKKGRVAENRARPEVAYEQYCAAAAENRGSGEVAEGLERVRPGAASHWEAQAITELDKGHYDQAWRMLMKVLEIEPDHANIPRMIDKLSREHPAEIASVRAEWVRTGSLGLTLPRAVVREATETRISTARGSRKTDRAKKSAGTKPPRLQRAKAAEPKTPPAVASHEEDQEAPLDLENDSLVRSGPVSAAEARRSVIQPRAGQAATDGRARETTEVSRQPWAKPRTAANSPPESDAPVLEEGGPPRKSPRPSAGSGSGEFLAVITLSEKDHMYPPTGPGIDGVEVKLRDTSDDMEADFDLFAAGKRIKKIRDLKIGRSQVFAGASGKLFRITLLAVHAKNGTVRLGIKAA